MVIRKNSNPFAGNTKPGVGTGQKTSDKKQSSGKRIGKSKPSKANNQLNRRVK